MVCLTVTVNLSLAEGTTLQMGVNEFTYVFFGKNLENTTCVYEFRFLNCETDFTKTITLVCALTKQLLHGGP